MKKSVSPLIRKEPVQSGIKCIATVFFEVLDNWKKGIAEKNFLIFYRNYYYYLPKTCNESKNELLNRPLKTASFQHLYFTFEFKI